MKNLMTNPTLSDLIGGIQAVTLGDEEARRRRTQKTVLERKQPPTFDVLIEIQTRDRFAVHHDVARVVDALLRGRPGSPELRLRRDDGEVEVRPAEREPLHEAAPLRRLVRIYPYALSEERLERAIQSTGAPARVARSLRDADLILTPRSYSKRRPAKLRDALHRDLPVHVLRSGTVPHIEAFLASLRGGEDREDEPEVSEQREDRGDAAAEAEAAARAVLERGGTIELAARPAATRREQHAVAERFGVQSVSRGRDPYRRVVLFPADT